MDNKGQVAVIVAILVISLFVAVLVIIQTYYVPNWMKDREAEHMDAVSNQFARLKYSIDLQAMEKSSSPLINSITLGSKELPYFVSSRAFGSLQILSSSESNFSIFLEGNGRFEKQFYKSICNENVSYVISLELLEIHINNLQGGDFYNISSPYFKISAKIIGQNMLNISLKVLNLMNGKVLFNKSIETGFPSEIKWINLMDPIYNFSTKILPYIDTPFNLSTNCSNNGTFILKGYKYGEKGSVSIPPIYIGKMGEIKYSSQNAYFVNQNYIYEGGAVILKQRTGNSIIYPPLMGFKNGSTPYINITAINIKGIAGKTGAAGYGTYSIRTNYSSYYHNETMGNISLIINSKYIQAWKKYIIARLNNTGIQYTYSEGSNYIKFNFKKVRIRIDVVTVYAQIGPGWVT